MDKFSSSSQKDAVELDAIYKSIYTLHFKNSAHEKKYQEMIVSESANHLGLNYNEINKTYMILFYGMILLYDTSYMWTYFEGNSDSKAFLFEIVLLSSACLVTTSFYFIHFFKNIQNSLKNVYLMFTYFLCIEIIIINCCMVGSKFYNQQIENGFFTILGIIPLIHSSKFVIFSNFLKYVLINSVLAISYLVFGLVFNGNNQKTIIEFLFLVLVL